MRTSFQGLVAVAAVLLMQGCVTTAVLTENTPVDVVAARPPAPEPEPEPPRRVEVEAERIRVDEKIHFELDSAEISAESDSLIQEIADVMNENPHVRKVRIEGHTDNQGAARYNMDLSNRRANSVRDALIEDGVSEDRLISEGYGLTRPIASNDTAEGRAQNRRVEFNIIEQDAPPAPAEGQGDAPAEGAAPAPAAAAVGQPNQAAPAAQTRGGAAAAATVQQGGQ